MDKKIWQEYALLLREVFGLETSPVGISLSDTPSPGPVQKKKTRMCRAILDAAAGETVFLNKDNSACFGADSHLGFQKFPDEKTRELVKQFVVEGEKLFASREAFDNVTKQIGETPDNSQKSFCLGPMEKAETQPALVVFVCNPEQACRILTLLMFEDGLTPKFQMGGPTCRMAIMYPLLSGEANLSFQDYTARKLTLMEKDKLLISVPYPKIPALMENLDKCSAGRAKVEYPDGFRQFLAKRNKGRA